MILFDCHAHVFEQISAIPESRYIPKTPASLSQWLQHLKEHRLCGGVIVQVSFLGTDNSELCSALKQLNLDHFAGVAVVSTAITDQEIDRLNKMGVKGFRWNLIRGAKVPDLNNPKVRSFLERIYARGMHIEVHLESPRLAHFIGPLLDFGGVVVVDHLGLPSNQHPENDPWLQAITRIKDLSGLYVKFSGAYRTPFNTAAHTTTILAHLLPDRVVWGSDWPHTQHEATTDYQHVANIRNEANIASDAKAVQALYGLKTTLHSN